MPFTSPILWQDNTHPHIYIYMCVFSELNFSSHQEGHTRTTKFGGLRSNLVEISPQMPSLVVCLRPPRFGNLCAERMWHLLRVFCFLFYSMFFHALVSGTSQDGTQRDGLRAHFLHAGREKTHATNVVVWKMSWPRLHLHRRIARCFFFFAQFPSSRSKSTAWMCFVCAEGGCVVSCMCYIRDVPWHGLRAFVAMWPILVFFCGCGGPVASLSHTPTLQLSLHHTRDLETNGGNDRNRRCAQRSMPPRRAR